MAMRADVNKLMGGELGGWLEQQEGMRAEAKKKAWNRWFYGGIALLPLLAVLWFGPAWGGGIKFWVSTLAFGGLSAWGYMPINAAKREIKIGINSAIARELGIEYQHDVEPGDEFDAVERYGLLPDYDRSNFEDLWFGEIEGHGFQLYEAKLEERRGSGKNRRWVTVFRGAIIAMQFGRDFYSTTLLQRAGKHKSWFGFGGSKDFVKFDGHELGYVDQVHPAFEDMFDIYSDDQVEARVIAHPSYVEHLMAVEQAFNGDAVRALFQKGAVLIVVESGNLFESGAISSVGDRARTETAARQFSSLAQLAMAINQTERGQAISTSALGESDDARPSNPAGFGRKGF
ncbi:MAG: DUF3137 domain-containing protein [Pseudomonadota bacterium]